MSFRNWLHGQLFPDFERWEHFQAEQWREAQSEAALLRTHIANQWWCPPFAPRRDDDEIVYAGWYHPDQRDGHDSYHTVVIRYPFGLQQFLEPMSSKVWSTHPTDEFSWGYGGGGPHALAITLLVHALGAKAVDDAFDQGHALVGPFLDQYIRNWRIEEPWELSRTEIRQWAEAYIAEHAKSQHLPHRRRHRRSRRSGPVARR